MTTKYIEGYKKIVDVLVRHQEVVDAVTGIIIDEGRTPFNMEICDIAANALNIIKEIADISPLPQGYASHHPPSAEVRQQMRHIDDDNYYD